jgi:Methyltransferase FkbM domain
LHTLDELALERVDLMKVDAEGAEFKIFRGAEKTLKRCRPPILSELSPEMLRRVSGVDVKDYFSFFSQLDYRCFIIDEHRLGEEIRAFPTSWPKSLSTSNALPSPCPRNA